MGFAIVLAGSGLLVFYYLGVLQVLSQSGFFNPGETPMGGLSGGAITSIQTCSGVPFQKQLMGFKMVLSYCQTTYPEDPYCGGQLGALIKQSVLMNIKTFGRTDPHLHCQDKLFVSMSVLDPLNTTILHPTSWTVSNFTSVEDLVEISGATSFLSCFMAAQPYTIVRNKPAIDGGYTSGFSHFCPPAAKRCIKVSAFTIGPNNPTGKEPNCTASSQAPKRQQPVRQQQPVTPLQQIAHQDQWKLPSKCAYDTTTNDITGPQQPPFVAADNPDIFPGNRFNYLQHDPCLLQSWAMSVLSVTPGVIQSIYDQGSADAAAWLRANPGTGV